MNRFDAWLSHLFPSSSPSGDNTSSNISVGKGPMQSYMEATNQEYENWRSRQTSTSSTQTDLPAESPLTHGDPPTGWPKIYSPGTTSSASSSTKPEPSAVRRPGDPVPHAQFSEIARIFGSLQVRQLQMDPSTPTASRVLAGQLGVSPSNPSKTE